MNEISKRVENIAPAVVVTGATQGVGRALAEEFARAGHTLFLVARDEAALAATAKALAKAHNVEVKFVAADLSTVEGCEAVVHLVAIIMGKPEDFERVMVRGTEDLVRAAEQAGVRRHPRATSRATCLGKCR